MNCFFCATPYHIIASITMASGMLSAEPSTLVILDHFNIDEAMVQRIRATGVFEEIVLYKSNNKTRMNMAKRLANVFCPDKVMHRLAHETAFSHCVFLALDFLNLAYMVKTYERRGIKCEFSFGDDGIGAYLNSNCYRPRKLVVNLLKLTGRLGSLQSVKKLYVYKPELMVENTQFELVRIEQSPETFQKLQKAVSRIFVMEPDVQVDNRVLYFEQLSGPPETDRNLAVEQEALTMAMEILGAEAAVKMHPRSNSEALWSRFPIVRTKIPFEAMVLQNRYAPALMMSNCSTAMFSMYLLDNLPAASCPSVFLNRLVPTQNESFNRSMERYFALLNQGDGGTKLYSPASIEELRELLCRLASKQAAE